MVRPDFQQNQAQQAQERKSSSTQVQVAPDLNRNAGGEAVETQPREVGESAPTQGAEGEAPRTSGLEAQARANPRVQQQQGVNQLDVFA
ncbi:MAG: hypothetical protein D6682_00740 [Zetaproteobacteria bacterium]|nr:MAG: hypothetical protein D6682_00740 [Zetaproteobacteria bacterium]